MIYKGKKFETYSEIISHALKLKGKAQKLFVRAYLRTGPHARSNIGYFAGYYGPEERAEIQRIFNADHPIFGRFK